METRAWAQRVDKLAAAILIRGAYGDPYWLTAKYPGRAQDGSPMKKGDKVLYYPRTKTVMAGLKAEQAWRDFQSEIADEDFYNRAAAAMIIGDIFYSSWGYDQTNVDFYQVVKVTPAMIALRQIDKRVTRGLGHPQEYVMPTPNKFVGPVLNKKVQAHNGVPLVRLNSYSNAYKWDGREKSQTGSGWGH